MRINIPEPCQADWDKMKIGLISRHCERCEKNVIDFRNYKREDIILYLLANKNEKVCGRFTRNQLDHVELEELIKPEALRKLPPQKAFTVLILACAMLASCSTSNPDPTPRPQKDTIVAPDTNSTKVDSNKVANDTLSSCSTNSLKAPLPEPVGIVELTGEVAIEQSIWADTTVVYQEDTLTIIEPMQPEEPLLFAEQMPEFAGGSDSLFAYLKDHLQYPESLVDADIEGIIYARFVVELDGSLSNITILRGIGPREFEDEVKRVLNNMPKWIPGRDKGHVARVMVTLPFKFAL
jgi:TonB family protein